MLLERWTGYLLSEAEEDEAARPRPAADAFVVASYPGKYSPDSSLAEQAAAAMEEGGRGSGERAEAAEHWRLGRLLLPLRHPERVAPAKDAQALSRKAEGILRRWMKDFRAPSSRAEAGFEAASLLNERGEWEAAVGLCDEVSAAEPRTLGAKKCARLAASIKTPTLGATGRATPPPGRKALTVSARNVRQLHLRLYPMTPERLRGLNRAVNDWTWSGALNRVEPDVLRRLLASQTPAKEWSIPVRPAAPHAPTSVDVDLPAGTAAGIYVVVACADAAFEPGSSLLSGAALNVTDLVLIGTTGLEGDERSFLYDEQGPRERTANAFHFYLLDGVTGKPAPGLPIEVRQAENWHWTDAHLETDETGRAQLPITVRLVPNVYNNHQADPLAGRDGRWAYWASPAGMSFVIPAPVELFVETDRPIYRPGQKVRYKATVVRRTPRGLEAYPGPTAVKVSARDANGQEFFSESKVPDANGGLDGELAIPAGRLLGSYQLYAQLPYAGGTFTGNGRFSVEEYKRPEFEVSVDEAEGAWRFGREATVRGSVKYFFGGPVPDAAVTYTVRRQVWRPWFCWWWSWRPADESAAEIARGTLRAGKDGKFSFAFTPKPADASEPDPLPARFIVSVSARDAGGRTLAAERAFTAGKSAYLFQLKPSAGFAAAGAPFSVTAKLVTLSEAPAEGKGGFQLRRLDQAPPPQPEAPDWSGGLMESPSLEQLYQSVPDGPLEREGKLAYAKGPGATIDLSGLKPGAYRLILKADDPWGGKVEQAIVLVAADLKAKSPLKLPSLSLPERTEYLAGETARILLGSADLSELIHVEVWGGRTLLSRAALPGAGLRVFSLPLAAVHKGGITVRWFGVQDFKLRSGSAAIAVPWRDKELKVSLAHDKALLPGQKVSWTLHAKDWRGRPVAGSALARVYDRSLEYYAKDSGPSPAALYQARSGPDQARGSLQAFFATQCEIDRGWIAAMIRLFQEAIGEPMPPGLRLNRGRVYGFQGGVMSRALGGAMAAGALEEAAPAPMAMAKNEAMDFKASDKLSEPGGGAQRAAAAPPPAEPKARSDFSETAYFGPRLPVVGGAARLEFAMPEQLTGWRIAGTVLTPDIKVGSFSEETATRKELMVRVELPRFLREGDEGTIKAVVHNESEAPLSGSLTLSAEEEEKPATERLGLSQLERSFSVAPHALAAFSWKLKAPRGTTRFKLRAVARAGEDVDAEERDLPILPSRQRLIESVVAALNGDSSKVLALKSLAAADPTRVSELAQVQVDPQLALTILNSLPYLVRYPYECV
ncbi:MAG TPA: alpha-2-macroglobulin family protein, partial [Elusimicrobiota bacterium]|nr:alpha-2-macroglobulin family protein [Elusimicrobiota bacterium]